nr:MAG TPA: Protein of unknown function (DUF3164) [Caudoviricetes sp.]
MQDTVVNAAIFEDPDENGIIVMNGKKFMADHRGIPVPLEFIRPQHKLEDETVRKIIRFVDEESARITRLRGNTMNDLGAFDALLGQEYGLTRGGPKGNRTYQTFDTLKKVVVQVSDFVDFGPELQIAKAIIDECLNEWSADAAPEIRAIVTRAFNTDKEGKINRAEIFMLLRLDITDERWKRAQDAIRDAMRVTGSKEYLRFYERKRITDKWRAITIDMAKA